MPMYDLECTGCADATVQQLSYRDTPPLCSKCGADTKRVILSAPAVKLRGCGWADDGYAITNMGGQAESDTADRNGRVVSFAGQTNRSSDPGAKGTP